MSRVLQTLKSTSTPLRQTLRHTKGVSLRSMTSLSSRNGKKLTFVSQSNGRNIQTRIKGGTKNSTISSSSSSSSSSMISHTIPSPLTTTSSFPGIISRSSLHTTAISNETSVAKDNQYLLVEFKDGRVEHLEGPTETVFDPSTMKSVSQAEKLVAKDGQKVVVVRGMRSTIIDGPISYTPTPEEWASVNPLDFNQMDSWGAEEHCHWAEVLRSTGEADSLDQALNHYRMALKENPNHPIALVGQANIDLFMNQELSQQGQQDLKTAEATLMPMLGLVQHGKDQQQQEYADVVIRELLSVADVWTRANMNDDALRVLDACIGKMDKKTPQYVRV